MSIEWHATSEMRDAMQRSLRAVGRASKHTTRMRPCRRGSEIRGREIAVNISRLPYGSILTRARPAPQVPYHVHTHRRADQQAALVPANEFTIFNTRRPRQKAPSATSRGAKKRKSSSTGAHCPLPPTMRKSDQTATPGSSNVCSARAKTRCDLIYHRHAASSANRTASAQMRPSP